MVADRLSVLFCCPMVPENFMTAVDARLGSTRYTAASATPSSSELLATGSGGVSTPDGFGAAA